MPRVLLLTDGLGNGGAERQLALLAKYLPPAWERQVWSLGDGPFRAVIQEGGTAVRIQPRKWRYDVTPFVDLWLLLKKWKPAVVHSWGWLCSAAAAIHCRALGIPWIDGSIRIGGVSRRNAMRARIVLSRADRVIANSRAGLSAWKIPETKGRVIYNIFDPARLERFEAITRPPHTAFTVTMAGRMSSAKDFESFVRAARLLNERDNHAWRFMALGSGPQKEMLINNAQDLIKKEVLLFPEAGLEILPFLTASDIGVLMTNPTYLQEGCSNTIMEYMACGLPVVCSDSGGNRELVEDGVSGFIIPPVSPEVLAAKLDVLRQSPDLTQMLGEAGRRRFHALFSLDRTIQEFVSVYQELLNGRA